MANLTEFLIGLSISMLLLAGAYKVLFVEQANLHSLQEQIELMQAMVVARYELKQAELSPKLAACGQVASTLAYANRAQDAAGRIKLAQGTSLQAFHLQDQHSLDLDKPGPGKALADTDILIIRKRSEQVAHLVETTRASDEKVVVTGSLNIKPGSVIILSDCLYVASNRVISISKHGFQQIISLQYPLGFDFARGSTLAKYQFEALYIGDTGRVNKLAKPISSLYVQDLKGVRHELVPNVVSLQAKLWVQPSHLSGWYQDLDHVDWQNVKAIVFNIKLKQHKQLLNYSVVLNEG